MADLLEPPAHRQAAVLLGVVFLLGAVCGAALFYLGQRSVRPTDRRGAPPPAHPMARLLQELDLDQEQHDAIRAILDEQRVQLEAFLESSRERIRAELRPDQQARFDTMRPPHPGAPAGPPPPGGHPPGHPPPPPPGHAPPPRRP